MTNFGFIITDLELEALVKIYRDDEGNIKYMDFINDANPFKDYIACDSLATGIKSTYHSQTDAWKGESDLDNLLYKIKC